MADSVRARLDAHVASIFESLGNDTISIAEVEQRALATAPAEDQAELLRSAVHESVRRVDKRLTARPEQVTLWGDLDRLLVVGQGLRRRKGSCNDKQMRAHLQVVHANRDAVVAAADAEDREYEMLQPHLERGLTVDEAVAEISRGVD